MITITVTPARVSIRDNYDVAIRLRGDGNYTGVVLQATLPADSTILASSAGVIAGNIVTINVGDVTAETDVTYMITNKIQSKTGLNKIEVFLTDENDLSETYEKEIIFYTFSYAGIFPRDVAKIGDKYPCVLIHVGDSELINYQGAIRKFQQLITLYCYSNLNEQNNTEEQLELIESYLFALQKALYEDFTLGGEIDCINEMSIERGGWLSSFDYETPGYTANMSMMKMIFKINYRE